jgi:hypothetical protein
LNKIIWGVCKFSILSAIVFSSGLAIIMHLKGSDFDPVRDIIKLKQENRRDDALDLTRFCIETQSADKDRLEKLEADLEYTFGEKIGAFSEGAIKGQVYDLYSGFGAISSDLCVYGDLRDIGIQAWYYFKDNPGFNSIVMALSSIGVILSTKPFLHGIDSFVKNTHKYVKRFSGFANQGILRKVMSRELPLKDSKKVWVLLKKTIGPYPAQYPAYQISAV